MKTKAVKVLESAYFKMINEKKDGDNIRKLLNSIRDFRGKLL